MPSKDEINPVVLQKTIFKKIRQCILTFLLSTQQKGRYESPSLENACEGINVQKFTYLIRIFLNVMKSYLTTGL